MRERIADFLPETYRAFLSDFFESPVADERHATCDNCAMCAPAQREMGAEHYFSPSTKCCTFHPALPNYAVGGLIADEGAAGREGRRRLLQKIAERIGVTPIAIFPPPRVFLRLRDNPQAFGRAVDLLCPYFQAEGGGCTVWAHREAECATWFCKHNHGVDGSLFWKQLRDYMVGVHRTLATWVLRDLGFDAELVHAESQPDEEQYRRMWGTWVGRERELYERAFFMVRDLDRTAYAELAGTAGRAALEQLANRYNTMINPRVPVRLVRNPSLRAVRAPDGSYVLSNDHTPELTRLRGPAYMALEYFDGRETAVARDEVRRHTDTTVGDGFLKVLYQHRILVDADSASDAGQDGRAAGQPSNV